MEREPAITHSSPIPACRRPKGNVLTLTLAGDVNVTFWAENLLAKDCELYATVTNGPPAAFQGLIIFFSFCDHYTIRSIFVRLAFHF